MVLDGPIVKLKLGSQDGPIIELHGIGTWLERKSQKMHTGVLIRINRR